MILNLLYFGGITAAFTVPIVKLISAAKTNLVVNIHSYSCVKKRDFFFLFVSKFV